MFSIGIDNLIMIEDEARRQVFEHGQRGGGGVNSQTEGGPDGQGKKSSTARSWGVGEMDYEALMRYLDNAVSDNPVKAQYLLLFQRFYVNCFFEEAPNLGAYPF